MANSTGDALVAVVVAEEAKVDMQVVAAGGRNPIFPPNHTLTKSGLLLDTKRRARYFSP